MVTHSRKRTAMFDLHKVTEMLDRIATNVQSKGLVTEAEQIDVISNTLDKMAMALTYKRRKSLPDSDFVFPAKHPDVTDGKDHFPIDTRNRARNALARANQFGSAPSWYNGSLKNLKRTIAEKVKRRYPDIEVTERSID